MNEEEDQEQDVDYSGYDKPWRGNDNVIAVLEVMMMMMMMMMKMDTLYALLTE